jgi:hypothetical protein
MPGTALVINDGNVCTADSCDPVSGVKNDAIPGPCCQAKTPLTTSCCTAGVQKATGESCSDGNLCNGAETCNASAVCASGVPVQTSDGNPCTDDLCNPLTGLVTNPPKADGSSCSSWSSCSCQSSSCTAVQPFRSFCYDRRGNMTSLHNVLAGQSCPTACN